jgi:hypothetical protein
MGGGGATGGTTGGGGASGTGGPDGGAADSRECFPECVAALRRSCERPAYGEGSCSEGAVGGNTVYCYSNGVREIRMATDGGVTVDFTQLDGQTICYRVVAADGGQSFRTPSGQEAAFITSVGGNVFTVTCGGVTTTVDSSDPNCRTLNSADCTAGACP